MSRIGNDLWWTLVRDHQESLGKGATFKEAEMEVFKTLYLRMQKDGMLQRDILLHFKNTFNIGMTAFYTRLRKGGIQHGT